MNKELQIDDLTRGINDDEPAFKGEGQAEQTVWYANSTATWPTRLTTATSVAAAVPTS